MPDPEHSPISFDWPDRTAFPLIVPWPTNGNIGGMLEFREASEWLAFLRQRYLHPAVPLIVAAKYQRVVGPTKSPPQADSICHLRPIESATRGR